jgi:DNA-directed RNA polymerase subunit M/transcription elongation factor TFIIS
MAMSNTLCPKCNAKGTVAVKQSRSDKGADLKYYECAVCGILWTNSIDIVSLPVES